MAPSKKQCTKLLQSMSDEILSFSFEREFAVLVTEITDWLHESEKTMKYSTGLAFTPKTPRRLRPRQKKRNTPPTVTNTTRNRAKNLFDNYDSQDEVTDENCSTSRNSRSRSTRSSAKLSNRGNSLKSTKRQTKLKFADAESLMQHNVLNKSSKNTIQEPKQEVLDVDKLDGKDSQIPPSNHNCERVTRNSRALIPSNEKHTIVNLITDESTHADLDTVDDLHGIEDSEAERCLADDIAIAIGLTRDADAIGMTKVAQMSQHIEDIYNKEQSPGPTLKKQRVTRSTLVAKPDAVMAKELDSIDLSTPIRGRTTSFRKPSKSPTVKARMNYKSSSRSPCMLQGFASFSIKQKTQAFEALQSANKPAVPYAKQSDLTLDRTPTVGQTHGTPDTPGSVDIPTPPTVTRPQNTKVIPAAGLPSSKLLFSAEKSRSNILRQRKSRSSTAKRMSQNNRGSIVKQPIRQTRARTKQRKKSGTSKALSSKHLNVLRLSKKKVQDASELHDSEPSDDIRLSQEYAAAINILQGEGETSALNSPLEASSSIYKGASKQNKSSSGVSSDGSDGARDTDLNSLAEDGEVYPSNETQQAPELSTDVEIEKRHSHNEAPVESEQDTHVLEIIVDKCEELPKQNSAIAETANHSENARLSSQSPTAKLASLKDSHLLTDNMDSDQEYEAETITPIGDHKLGTQGDLDVPCDIIISEESFHDAPEHNSSAEETFFESEEIVEVQGNRAHSFKVPSVPQNKQPTRTAVTESIINQQLPENQIYRNTRSKQRKINKDNEKTHSVCNLTTVEMKSISEMDETKQGGVKRQSDYPADESLSKRHCKVSIAQIDQDIINNLQMTGNGNTLDISETCKTPSPQCPQEKVVRPFSAQQHSLFQRTTPISNVPLLMQNRANYSTSRLPFNMAGSGVKTLLKTSNTPHTPSFQELQEAKKRKWQSKEMQMEERLKKRKENQQKKAEERKKKYQERVEQVRQAKLEQEKKKEQELRTKLSKPLKELPRADPLKEGIERQKLRLRQVILDERKKQEENERLALLKAQEETQRKVEENLLKKKQQDEARKHKIAEDRRRKQEELAERERQKQELMRQKQIEADEADKIRLIRQQEKEKEQARLRAERDKEAEKRKDRQRKLAEELRQWKEQEKIKYQREAEELKESQHQEEKKRLMNRHNLHYELNKTHSSSTSAVRQMFGQQVLPHVNRPPQANPPPLSSKSRAMTLTKDRVDADTMSTTDKSSRDVRVPGDSNRQTVNTSGTASTLANSSMSSYDMTPIRQPQLNSSQDYGIDELRSDDETDEEDEPVKEIPTWANARNVVKSSLNQAEKRYCRWRRFGQLQEVDLNSLFVKKKNRFNIRTSSAIWDLPPYLKLDSH